MTDGSAAWRRACRSIIWTVRLGAAALALSRLARAARAAPPVRAGDTRAVTPRGSPAETIDVVVPARDEAARVEPLLRAVVGAPGVGTVIVVDDESSDATATVAERAGARVVAGMSRPPGWAGKSWALQQGLLASDADWVVTFDADARPDGRLPAALVARAGTDRLDLLTVAGRFDCPTSPSRWLHAAMLTTLVYRFGPPGVDPRGPDRAMANGQCMTVRRRSFLEQGGMSAVASQMVEDVALARRLALTGRRVAFLDAGELLVVRMYESFGDTWRGWGRSLALPGVETRRRQLTDLTVIVTTMVLPLPRFALGRGDMLDALLLAARLGTLVGTRRAYERGGLSYWLSPVADPIAATALALGIGRRRNVWRGRRYVGGGRAQVPQ